MADREEATPAQMTIGTDAVIRCAGAWALSELPAIERMIAGASWPAGRDLIWDAGQVTAMDSGGAVLLHRTLAQLERQGIRVALRGLRPEFAELLRLVSAHWTRVGQGTAGPSGNWLEQVGAFAWNRLQQWIGGLGFLGESAVALVRSLAAPRSIRWRALWNSLELDGFNALPIIGLLTFLMGIVIAYQGAEQLRTVGANIFIVDLVGIALLREIAPLVTAILVAGRSGSAYTAQIGTMKVTEELDALRTLGLSPMKVLVLPKVLSLAIALPLLTVYADVVGVFGGMLIAASQLSVTFLEFLTRFEEAIALRHFLIGVVKAPVFAAIIALVGCYQGFQIRGGVDDVGRHTTISVVQSIFLVIVFDAFFSILLSWWKL
jgi:phospholipid/cholesterol/gamma-HCH transport system permease protein